MFFDSDDTNARRIATEAEVQEIINWVFGPSTAIPPKRKTISLLGADLRVPCGVDAQPSTGNHKHVCGACRTAWQHDDELPHAEGIDHDKFTEAHSCPRCGKEQYWKAD